ncbi:hypothetical protein R1flu_023338 [Riccia fluitans]|uniref:Uncharacterized protein n=1 Tax=Riccia fluitans TaxID=41844 RepID=A0ABD1XRT8_9MARC
MEAMAMSNHVQKSLLRFLEENILDFGGPMIGIKLGHIGREPDVVERNVEQVMRISETFYDHSSRFRASWSGSRICSSQTSDVRTLN